MNSRIPAIALTLALTFLHPSFADPQPIAQPQQITLTILHDNDLHGHLLPFAYTETGVSKVEQASVGGAARRATLVRQLRKEIHNPTILVDSGDTTTRGPLTTTYEGAADIAAMNAVGYQLGALGNNEFKLKDAADKNDAAGAQGALLQFVKRSNFPWLCANAVDGKGAFLEGVQPYVVKEFNGVRVGFLGLTAPRSASYPQTKGWTITDPIAAAQEWIPKARAHCDILIAVTHIGTDMDKDLAAKTAGLDAIVGGDSHTYLYQAVEVKNTDGVAVPIVQDGEFGVRLGRFDLHLAKDGQGRWHLAKYEYKLLPITAKLKEASDVRAALAPYVAPFETVIGHLDTIGATPDARTLQTGQVIVAALREETGADLALIASADGLFEVFRHKDVTRYDVFAALPFHDIVATANLTGAEIHTALAAQPGTVSSGDITHLDPAKTYKVAFIDFEATSAYKIAKERLTDGPDSRQVVIDYLGNLSPRR